LAYDLKGHQQSVWAVLGVDEDKVLTGNRHTRPVEISAGRDFSIGSADKTIKLWQNHKALHTFTGHQDAVRGLALIQDIGFASCSNDR